MHDMHEAQASSHLAGHVEKLLFCDKCFLRILNNLDINKPLLR